MPDPSATADAESSLRFRRLRSSLQPRRPLVDGHQLPSENDRRVWPDRGLTPSFPGQRAPDRVLVAAREHRDLTLGQTSTPRAPLPVRILHGGNLPRPGIGAQLRQRSAGTPGPGDGLLSRADDHLGEPNADGRPVHCTRGAGPPATATATASRAYAPRSRGGLVSEDGISLEFVRTIGAHSAVRVVAC